MALLEIIYRKNIEMWANSGEMLETPVKMFFGRTTLGLLLDPWTPNRQASKQSVQFVCSMSHEADMQLPDLGG